MVDIQSVAAEIRRGKKDRKKIEDRKKLQGKNIMAPLLHRATIKKPQGKNITSASATQGGHNLFDKLRLNRLGETQYLQKY